MLLRLFSGLSLPVWSKFMREPELTKNNQPHDTVFFFLSLLKDFSQHGQDQVKKLSKRLYNVYYDIKTVKTKRCYSFLETH